MVTLPSAFPERLLIVSHSSGMPGFSPSEWLEDKLQIAAELGQSITLLTGSQSNLKSRENLKVIKIPSLSAIDCKAEFTLMRNSNMRIQLKWKLWALVFWPFGKVFDILFRFAAGKNSDGKWSWVVPGALVVAYFSFRSDAILATGGPSGAHLAACLGYVNKKIPLILEFQDPFIGSEMHLSARALKGLSYIESFMIAKASKVVYATSQASVDVKKRYPEHSTKITFIYPGAYAYQIKPIKKAEPENLKKRGKEVIFLHLGTLYGSRNLSTFSIAVNQLAEAGAIEGSQIKVVNVGANYTDEHFSGSNIHYEEVAALPRTDALTFANRADVLLLVQHADSRSRETIPFKTYDYLNLKKPMLGIINNPELEILIRASGGATAQNNDVSSIKTAILEILAVLETVETQSAFRIDEIQAWKGLVTLGP